jgi:hypothetical protein
MSSCGPVIATGEETGKGQRYRYGEHTAEKGYSSAVVKVGCGPVISTGEGMPGIGVGAGYWYDKHTTAESTSAREGRECTTAVEKVDFGSVISTAAVRYDEHTAE